MAIKRADIGAKVLPQNSGRVFKQVFEMAQGMLRETFGMEMAELPRAEKVDLVARRKGMLYSSCLAFTLRSNSIREDMTC